MYRLKKILDKVPMEMRPHIEKIVGHPLKREWIYAPFRFFTPSAVIGVSRVDNIDRLLNFVEAMVGLGNKIWGPDSDYAIIRRRCEDRLIQDYAYNVVLIQRSDLPTGLRKLHANIERAKFNEVHKKLLKLGLVEENWNKYFERASKGNPRSHSPLGHGAA